MSTIQDINAFLASQPQGTTGAPDPALHASPPVQTQEQQLIVQLRYMLDQSRQREERLEKVVQSLQERIDLLHLLQQERLQRCVASQDAYTLPLQGFPPMVNRPQALVLYRPSQHHLLTTRPEPNVGPTWQPDVPLALQSPAPTAIHCNSMGAVHPDRVETNNGTEGRRPQWWITEEELLFIVSCRERQPRPWSFQKIADHLGCSKSTASRQYYNYLQTQIQDAQRQKEGGEGGEDSSASLRPIYG
ncbi:MAG: hypothetical protein J3Q66DRAFT_367418 [Benniella sp.]|nr:MAG: hypothetical protein J3Q66DRAFT_367418 [Benniella sp.]